MMKRIEASRTRIPAARRDSCMRSARLHGPTMSNATGRPRQEAASTWIGTSGDSMYAPSQDSRASKGSLGSQRGTDGVKRAGSRPAAAKSSFQSGAAAGPGEFSTCGGAARKRTSWPRASSPTATIPDTTNGGSFARTAMPSFRGTISRGLCR